MTPRRLHVALALCAGALPMAANAAPAPAFSGADTAWMLVSTVLVLLMTMPGIGLFYSGMLRSKNALSIVAHTVGASAVITLVWAMVGYTLAFDAGSPWLGGLSRSFVAGLFGTTFVAHPIAPTIPETAFFLFQLAFAIVSFAVLIGATVERMRMGVTLVFAALWCLVVYAPVAHWVWHPDGWLARMGHMDFAGGTVVHLTAGMSALAAARVVGPRNGFGTSPMPPHNLLITVLGAGLLWAGWFGFNAGSAFEAGTRAAGAVLATQVAACAGAMTWGISEYVWRGQWSVLGTMTGAIAGLVAVTPASGFVAFEGAMIIGVVAGLVCFMAVMLFKQRTGIDDSLDVFALHGIGGLLGTVLTPLLANPKVAPVTATVWTNLLGSLAVAAWSALATALILGALRLVTRLRVSREHERVGLDIAQHGEMLTPNT